MNSQSPPEAPEAKGGRAPHALWGTCSTQGAPVRTSVFTFPVPWASLASGKALDPLSEADFFKCKIKCID